MFQRFSTLYMVEIVTNVKNTHKTIFDVKLKLIGEFVMKEKVLILGLSKSGIAAAKYAVKQGYDVYITESKPLDKVKEECRARVDKLKNEGIKIECGYHS